MRSKSNVRGAPIHSPNQDKASQRVMPIRGPSRIEKKRRNVKEGSIYRNDVLYARIGNVERIELCDEKSNENVVKNVGA